MTDKVKEPNFFIVGGEKCGTTSLSEYLRQHPQVFMPYPRKEPGYFVPKGKISSKFIVEDREEYLSLFKNAKDEKAIGEASTTYLYFKESAQEIKKVIPDAKIIIMLRNPVEVAYSLYLHKVQKGSENLSFEEAIKAEDERMRDPAFIEKTLSPHIGHFYTNCPKFYNKVKNYLDIFGSEQVLVIFMEDMKKEPLKICREVCSFLGVDADFKPKIRVYNPARISKLPGFNFYLRYTFPKQKYLLKIGRFLLPSENMRQKIMEAIIESNLSSKRVPELKEETREILKKEFAEDIAQLEKLLDVDLSHWKK